MGTFVSRTWFIYARGADDNWLEEPLASTISHDDDIKFHMGRFKHYAFSLALGKLEEGIKKIYLYQGRRVARAESSDGKIYVRFSSHEAVVAWSECKRSKLGLEFDRRFDETSSGAYDVSFTRVPDSQVVSR
tara:strand:+ start:973 stop:1368 length:396 start_codon:yes stop_codon:yes gene_type:complete